MCFQCTWSRSGSIMCQNGPDLVQRCEKIICKSAPHELGHLGDEVDTSDAQSNDDSFCDTHPPEHYIDTLAKYSNTRTCKHVKIILICCKYSSHKHIHWKYGFHSTESYSMTGQKARKICKQKLKKIKKKTF